MMLSRSISSRSNTTSPPSSLVASQFAARNRLRRERRRLSPTGYSPPPRPAWCALAATALTDISPLGCPQRLYWQRHRPDTHGMFICCFPSTYAIVADSNTGLPELVGAQIGIHGVLRAAKTERATAYNLLSCCVFAANSTWSSTRSYRLRRCPLLAGPGALSEVATTTRSSSFTTNISWPP